MSREIVNLTFKVSFFKNEETLPVVFTISVDRHEYTDPKDAVIDHITCKWDEIQKEVGNGFLPKFKTFEILGSRRLSDTAW